VLGKARRGRATDGGEDVPFQSLGAVRDAARTAKLRLHRGSATIQCSIRQSLSKLILRSSPPSRPAGTGQSSPPATEGPDRHSIRRPRCTPWERYQSDLRGEGFVHDAAQERAVRRLQRVYEELLTTPEPARGPLSRWLQRLQRRETRPVKGLYLWGGVGRGKTYLVDAFFDCLPFERKRRQHFHRFMAEVHEALRHLPKQPDPLEVVAAHFARQTRVLCFDELFVSDITDAMLLGGLLRALFARGVTVVATSNVPPDDLYRDGLQRALFLPAIALLKEHLEVLNTDGGTDYRLRALERAEIYHTPLDEGAERALLDAFQRLAPEPGRADEALEVDGRSIPARLCADGVIWFDFRTICGGPRSQRDYLEIARCFQTVLVSDVPQLSAENDDAARRFINLVDVFYDRNVKLVLSAAAEPERLYGRGRLSSEFARTVSRLQEMRSHDYLARPHLP
jgi:cell division protein ZapE